MLRAEAPGGLDPVHSRHADVEEHDVRVQLGGGRERVRSGRGLAEHLEVSRGADHVVHDLAEGHMIVDHEHADRRLDVGGHRSFRLVP